MPITGKYTQKLYRCTRCGHEELHGTNHYGEIYPRCNNCSWRNPLQPQATHICLESLPEGWGTPEPWRFAKLGEVAKVLQVL